MSELEISLARNTDCIELAELSRVAIEYGLRWRWKPSKVLELIKGPESCVIVARTPSGELMGFAAIKALSQSEGEIKSVRTHPDHLRKGVSRRLMDHLETEARKRGYNRLVLETHPSKQYEAARALYERRGYAYRGPFGDYAPSPDSVFMELLLNP